MGICLNPGNAGFRQILKGTYVDKTGLIDFVNGCIDTPDKMICVSRPRRFGKSYAARMLAAYYDKSCDSGELFCNLSISKTPDYREYLNGFNVIYLDMTSFVYRAQSIGKNIVSEMQRTVIHELGLSFPEYVSEEDWYLPDVLAVISQETGEKFFIIIDDWDIFFREAMDDLKLQKSYALLLRGLFKGGPATDISIAGVYMTGILPVKKYGVQSVKADFREFTMLNPHMLAEYVGFTEDEVRDLCRQYDMDFDGVKHWYDGYSFQECQPVYNPNSVMSAVKYKKLASYWSLSETDESLKQYISMNLAGLRDAVIFMLGNLHVKVDTLGTQDDLTNFRKRDDVLTLLVHLGYLAYDESTSEVYIPNFDVAESFRLAITSLS